MKYQQALGEWGARKLEHANQLPPGSIPWRTVSVEMQFDLGYSGGCSCDMGPTSDVVISSSYIPEIPNPRFPGSLIPVTIDVRDFDFGTVLGEIVRAGGGVLIEPF